MLYIVFDRNFKERTEREQTWYVGTPVPNIEPHRIIELQADGDEKEYIESKVGPTIKGDVAHFYGDIARNIFINL